MDELASKIQFGGLLLTAIDEGLRNELTKGEVNALKFYVDPSIALADPDIYAGLLERIFGEQRTKVLFSHITDRLSEMTELEKQVWQSFDECVKAAKLRYGFR